METRHFVTLLDWMRSLGLKGNELIAYAIVYGFSQDADSDFHGSVAYIADWCGISRQQAMTILQKLTDAGLILKTADPGRPAHYRAAIMGQGVKFPTMSNNLTGGVKKVDTPCQETLHNNKEDSKEYNKDTHSLPRVREDKVLYGDCVLLTEKEHAALVRDYGAADTARLIEILDLYLANKTKDPYKSHYAAIRKWCVRDLAEQKTAEQRLKNAQEAGQRVNAQQQKPQGPPPGNYAALADANRRFKEITDKYKN